MIKLKPLIISLAISLGVGGLSALFADTGSVYSTITMPPLAPPAWLFPVVWSILFILMGISAYLIYMEGGEKRRGALIIYGVQLAVNFVWPILFFQMQAFLVSFIWLALLWLLVLIMIIAFYRIKPLAAYLQIPYLVWLTFAGYLNLAIYLLNR